MKLRISNSLSLPADTATSTLVVYGGKGMGKTNLASVLVEEFSSAGLRFVVVDPMGVWWGLRYGADGKSAGIRVLILGGLHGDLPIAPESGSLVADLVVDEDDSVIVDISRRPDGSMWSIGERVRFVTEFSKRVYQRQGEKRRPLHLVIDEAARFAPQVVRQGDTDVAKCMGAVAVIVEEGRNVGIGVTLVTQRSARLNKDVAELADCMIAFRTVGPNSMRAVLDWLGEHVEKSRLKEIGEQLRSLPRGSALVVSPGWLEFEGVVAMRMRTTFDSSATPKVGKELRVAGAGAKVDLSKYRARLADLVEQQRSNDPAALKADLAKARKAIAILEAGAERSIQAQLSKPGNVREVAKPSMVRRVEALISKVETTRERWRADGEALRLLVHDLGARADELRIELARVTVTTPKPHQELPNRVVRGPQLPLPPAITASKRRDAEHQADDCRKSSIGCTIGGGLRRILIALAQRDGLTNRQIGIRATLSSKSGTFATYISKARKEGWIADGDNDRNKRHITHAGLAALGSYDPLPTGRELGDYWIRELKNSGAARILQVLIDAYPNELDDETIGERAKLSAGSGTYATYVSKLRGLELISGRGRKRASEELFE